MQNSIITFIFAPFQNPKDMQRDTLWGHPKGLIHFILH
jgi:hypothetical protein